MLGIIVALPDEAHCLVGKRVSVGQQLLLDQQRLLYVSGIGAKRAAVAAAQLINAGATQLLSWGTAGALDAELMPGDVIIPDHVLVEDQQPQALTASWQQQLRQGINTTVFNKPLLSSTYTINTPQQKQTLLERTGAIAVDMETAAIAQVAKQCELPVACIRVIVDPADFALPKLATQAMSPNGKLIIHQLLWCLLRYPKQWRDVAQLAKHFATAKKQLQQLANSEGIQYLSRVSLDPAVKPRDLGKLAIKTGFHGQAAG